MPKIVVCPFCNKSLLTSTYGILYHVNSCEKNREVTIQEIKNLII